MTGDGIRIRAARPDDAAALSRLLNGLSVHEGKADDVYTPESVARQFFGAEPVSRVLIAENASGPVGYAAFEETFNTDCGEPGLWLHDIYVDAPVRGCGLGRRLMAAVAQTALAEGRTSVWWGVRDTNHAALRFYAGLGARDEGARLQELDGPALVSLARDAPIVD